MNVQSAGSCRMAEIIHATGLAENFCPWHFVQVIFERHRVCNELQAFIQTAVRLDVEIFCVGVRDVEQLLRVAVDRAAVVDFKLNAEMPQALAMKNKVWRVAVFVNNLAVLIPAGRAVGVVVIIPIRAVTMNNAVAVFAADVVFIKAVVAECVGIVLDGVFLVDPLGSSGRRLRSGGRCNPRRASHFPLGTFRRLGILHRSLHKFLFRSLSVPPFRIVNLNILQRAA